MENKETNRKIFLNSAEWLGRDEAYACRPFIRAGFSNTEEILELRVFDMLNILGIDRIMAEEMMYALYRFFNENRQADDALYNGTIDQYFDFTAWRAENPDVPEVKVKDIVLADGMNFDALTWLFNRVVRKFWKSPEYDSRNYRYWGYRDLVQQKEGELTK
ncbi:MAG: hypothetical protein IKZ95_03210 [Lachnospiraceae bacterium]|nr:hypothetical protein [Lachnospiraceae bacterium]